MRKPRLNLVDRAEVDLPDYSADWWLLEGAEDAPNTEIAARFYYEFARESRTILSLTERLCHFSRGEILRAQGQTLSYPGSPLRDLHPYCFKLIYALLPEINLRELGWNCLRPEQRQSLIEEFSPGPAFRQLEYLELFAFAEELIKSARGSSPQEGLNPDLWPRWYGSSRLYWGGIEEIAICVDWRQGSQAVKAAMQEWFQRHKRELSRLKSGGKLPGHKHGSYMFHLHDKTGAANPRRKYMAALRGLGAMRLLSSQTLRKAIKITKGSLYSSDVRSRSAWNVGVRAARQAFQELFYPQDEYSLRIRRHSGLPAIEKPVSYQRYCLRTGRNK